MAQWLSSDDLRPSNVGGGGFCRVEECDDLLTRPFNALPGTDKRFLKQTLAQTLFIERLCHGVSTPKQIAMGLEMHTAESGLMGSFESMTFRLGFKIIECPPNVIGRFVPLSRPEFAHIMIGSSIIEPRQTTELKVRLTNLSNRPFTITFNAPICVLMFTPLVSVQAFECLGANHIQKTLQNTEESPQTISKTLSTLSLTE